MPIDASIPARFAGMGLSLPNPIQQYSTLAALKQQAAQAEALKAQQQKDATIAQLLPQVLDPNSENGLNMSVFNQLAAIDPEAPVKIGRLRDLAMPKFAMSQMTPVKVENYSDPQSGQIGTLLVTPGGQDRFIPQSTEGKPKAAPKRETREADGFKITEEWDAANGQWREVGRTKMDKPADKAATTQASKASEGITSMQSAYDVLDMYESLLDSKGPALMDAELDAAYTALTLEMKNVAQLGALAGPDLGLLQGMITPPTSVKGQAFGKEGLKKQLALIRQRMDKAKGRLEKIARQGAGEITAPGSQVGGQKIPAAPKKADPKKPDRNKAGVKF